MIPYTHGSPSSANVPNSRSQMMRVPAWFLSMYWGLRAWWTRWWEGVLKTHSIGPSLPMRRVCTQNW